MSALPPKADIEGQTRDCAGFILETGIAVKGRPSGHRAERFQTVCGSISIAEKRLDPSLHRV